MDISTARRTLKVLVVTRDRADLDRAPREKEIDWFDSSDRRWLKGHETWAMDHNHQVTLYPL